MDDQMHQTSAERLSIEQILLEHPDSFSLDAVFDAMEDGIFVYDAFGHVIRTNPVARELLGGKELYCSPSTSLQEGMERFLLRDPTEGLLLTEEQ